MSSNNADQVLIIRKKADLEALSDSELTRIAAGDLPYLTFTVREWAKMVLRDRSIAGEEDTWEVLSKRAIFVKALLGRDKSGASQVNKTFSPEEKRLIATFLFGYSNLEEIQEETEKKFGLITFTLSHCRLILDAFVILVYQLYHEQIQYLELSGVFIPSMPQNPQATVFLALRSRENDKAQSEAWSPRSDYESLPDRTKWVLGQVCLNRSSNDLVRYKPCYNMGITREEIHKALDDVGVSHKKLPKEFLEDPRIAQFMIMDRPERQAS